MEITKEITVISTLLLLLALSFSSSAETVRVIDINGNVDAGTYSYLSRVIDEAKAGDAELIIIRINTYGGLIKPAKNIINKIESSKVKVVAYSFETNGGALSLGSYILMSSELAAIAPESVIGNAQPPQEDNESIEEMADYMANLASHNSRNSSAARDLVISNLQLNGTQALEEGLINYAPNSTEELLKNLSPASVTVSYDSPSVFDMVFGILSSPQVFAFFFLLGSLSGVYTLITKHTPAALFAFASYIVALWVLQNIELSLLGLALIVLGLILISLEALHTRPSIFGVTGGVAASIGSISIAAEPFYYITPETILTTLILTFLLAGLSIIIGNRLGRARAEKIHSEAESLVGQKARVIEELRRNGLVKVDGKIWPAYSIVEEKIETDAVVEVVKKEGRLLSVVRVGGPKTKGHIGHNDQAGHGGQDEHEEQSHGTDTHSDVPKKDLMSHSESGHDDGLHHTTGGPDKNLGWHDHND